MSGYKGLGVFKRAGQFIANLFSDPAPKLGADLDANNKKIINAKSIELGNQGIRLQYFEDINNMIL